MSKRLMTAAPGGRATPSAGPSVPHRLAPGGAGIPGRHRGASSVDILMADYDLLVLRRFPRRDDRRDHRVGAWAAGWIRWVAVDKVLYSVPWTHVVARTDTRVTDTPAVSWARS
jgi:hypothetical protein